MSRAQCFVFREQKILMVQHRHSDGDAYWCLPGGGIETDELPEAAARRELWEECGVRGTLIRPTAQTYFDVDGDAHFTFLLEIGDQTPELGFDPELAASDQILTNVGWLSLDDLMERDRVYLWSAGLLGLPGFADWVSRLPRTAQDFAASFLN